jgi:hypothetical protein
LLRLFYLLLLGIQFKSVLQKTSIFDIRVVSIDYLTIFSNLYEKGWVNIIWYNLSISKSKTGINATGKI